MKVFGSRFSSAVSLAHFFYFSLVLFFAFLGYCLWLKTCFSFTLNFVSGQLLFRVDFLCCLRVLLLRLHCGAFPFQALWRIDSRRRGREMQAERGCDFEKVKLWSHNLLALAVRSSEIDETEREKKRKRKR